MNDWKDLTVQVLHTIDRAHGRLQGARDDPHRVGRLESELAKDRVIVEKIRSNYEIGDLIATVQQHEVPQFQNLVRGLSTHHAELESGEVTLVVENFKDYLRTFFDVGPHGPGGGKPGIAGRGPRGGGGGGRGGGSVVGPHGAGAAAQDAGTHGSGRGKPGS